MVLGFIVTRQTPRSVANRPKTEYLSGMPPKFKLPQWTAQIDQGYAFDEEDAHELKNRLEARPAGFLFFVKVVRREPEHALTLLDPKTRREVYGEKGWKDYRQDRVTNPGCNEQTGQLF